MTQPYAYPQQPAAPQMPQMPQFPQQPQPNYYQQPAQPPGYYPQQTPPPAPQQQQQQLAAGSLDAFYSQPSTGGGKALTFNNVGDTYTFVVARPITNGDIQQQTDTRGVPQTYKDGRPKFVMVVPVQMQPSPNYPDGQARWYVKGQARDELVRAMAEAGAPEGPPEAAAVIQVTHTGTRPSGPGMNPAKLFQVVYRRPEGAAAPVPVSGAPAQAPVSGASAPAAAPAQIPPPAVPAAPQVPAQAPVPVTELTPEQQALLAQLTNPTAA